MKNVRVAFDILDKEKNLEPGRTYLECYMIFDVKMDLTRKARFIANGSNTPDDENTYAGVVSRETVRIAFAYHVALNELDVTPEIYKMPICRYHHRKNTGQYVVQNCKDAKL